MIAIVFLVLGLLRVRLAWVAIGMVAALVAPVAIEYAAGRAITGGHGILAALNFIGIAAAFIIGGAIRTGIDRFRGVAPRKT